MTASRHRLVPEICRAHAHLRIVRVVVQDLVRAAARPRCAVCGTRLLHGDPVSFCGTRPAHAECALVHWLAHRRDRSPRSSEVGRLGERVRHKLGLPGLDEPEDVDD